MATSGTYTFTVTAQNIVEAALRVLQVYGIGDPIPAQAITDTMEALNIWVKAMVKGGLFLWTVQDLQVPMVAAQATYSVGPLSSQPRPLRILDAYLRNSSGNDTTLSVTSRYDYDTLGLKSAQGIPNQLFYDPQLGNGVITLYNVPIEAGSTLHIIAQRQIQDFTSTSDNPDFPQEAFQMLKWGLADEISLEQGAREAIIDRVAMRAKAYRTEFEDWQMAQEAASVYFSPSGNGQGAAR